MTTDVQLDRVAMSPRECDVLKVMQGVLDGKRAQAQIDFRSPAPPTSGAAATRPTETCGRGR
jgi:hypothetical protein